MTAKMNFEVSLSNVYLVYFSNWNIAPPLLTVDILTYPCHYSQPVLYERVCRGVPYKLFRFIHRFFFFLPPFVPYTCTERCGKFFHRRRGKFKKDFYIFLRGNIQPGFKKKLLYDAHVTRDDIYWSERENLRTPHDDNASQCLWKIQYFTLKQRDTYLRGSTFILCYFFCSLSVQSFRTGTFIAITYVPVRRVWPLLAFAELRTSSNRTPLFYYGFFLGSDSGLSRIFFRLSGTLMRTRT